MQYENPLPPDSVNLPDEHPLADFLKLLVGVVALFLVLLGTSYLLAGLLLPHMPMSLERKLLAQVDSSRLFGEDSSERGQQVRDYLQDQADLLLHGIPVPDDFEITLHYSPLQQANAFATLGGNIVVTQGLLDTVQTENGLAMVLGHEIGHLLQRDPLLATGRMAVTVGGLALLAGFSPGSVADSVFNVSAESLLLGYSRRQERSADLVGLQMLRQRYGHTAGATEFFESIMAANADAGSPGPFVEFFSTHPDPLQRLARLRESPDGFGQRRALPDFVSEVVSD